MSTRTLFLDFASGKQLIALVKDDRTIAVQSIDGKSESALIPMIEELVGQPIAKSQLPKAFDRIAAVTGPGGFMSLRVGISLANALSDGLKIPLAGIHLSDLWLARLRPSSPSPFSRGEKGEQKKAGGGAGVRVVWLHSTKKEFLFIRGFGSLEKEWPEAIFLSIEALHSKLMSQNSHLDYVGELIESQQASLPMLKPLTDIRPLEDVLPTIVAALAYEQKPLLPWYGRGS